MSDIDIATEIRAIAADAESLAAQLEYDSDAWDALHERIEALDAAARVQLPPDQRVAVGRYIDFTYGDGAEIVYIIDRILGDRVHCVWIANGDEYMADAVDGGGWTLRSIAERDIERRAWKEQP